MSFKKRAIVLVLIIVVLMLGSCGSRWSTDRYRELSRQCVEKEEGLLLEIYERQLSNEDFNGLASFLEENYSIYKIRYSISSGKLEFWFNEKYINRNYAIIYFPPGTLPNDDVGDKEHTEEIKNGFYFYIEYLGLG